MFFCCPHQVRSGPPDVSGKKKKKKNYKKKKKNLIQFSVYELKILGKRLSTVGGDTYFAGRRSN